MKYWTIDKETREVIGCGDTDKWNMPRNVLLVEPLPAKEGFAVVAKADLSGTEYVEDNRGKTIYNTTTKESKKVEYLGEIESGWTLLAPTSELDEWNGVAWVKNIDLAFSSEIKALNEKHYQDVLSATIQYNIAVARDGSTESDKIATARALIADIDAQFELDQLSIITKYYGA